MSSLFFDAPDDDAVPSGARKVKKSLSKAGKTVPAAAPAATLKPAPVVSKEDVPMQPAPPSPAAVTAAAAVEIDPAFLYDEVYDALRAEKATAVGANIVLDSSGSKFGDSVAAAKLQREWDFEDRVVTKNRVERAAEVDDEALHTVDAEMGVFETRSYLKRKEERRAAREGRSIQSAEEEDSTMRFVWRSTATATAAHTASMDTAAPSTLAAIDVEAEVEGVAAQATSDEPAAPQEPHAAAAEPVARAKTAAERAAEAEATLARFEAAKVVARRNRAQERLPGTAVEAYRQTFLRRQVEYSELLHAEALGASRR